MKTEFEDDLTISKEGIVYLVMQHKGTEVAENEAGNKELQGLYLLTISILEKLELLKDELFFANGLALNEDESYLCLVKHLV